MTLCVVRTFLLAPGLSRRRCACRGHATPVLKGILLHGAHIPPGLTPHCAPKQALCAPRPQLFRCHFKSPHAALPAPGELRKTLSYVQGSTFFQTSPPISLLLAPSTALTAARTARDHIRARGRGPDRGLRQHPESAGQPGALVFHQRAPRGSGERCRLGSTGSASPAQSPSR